MRALHVCIVVLIASACLSVAASETAAARNAEEARVLERTADAGTAPPPRERQQGLDPVSTRYRVSLEIASGRQLYEARRLGIDVVQPGSHQVEMSGSELLALRERGFRFHVIGGTTQFTLASEFSRDPLYVPMTNVGESNETNATGTIELFSGQIDVLVEDNTGNAQGYQLRDPSAPAGAQVTDVRYRTRLSNDGDSSFWCGDYEIWLFSGSPNFDLRVYDNLGGSTDGNYDDDVENDADIYLNWRSTSAFDGEDPNQWWGILAEDNLAGDDGKIDYIEFQIDWVTTASGDSYEPDNESYQARSHALNFTSAFRSIDPAGDRDWITFVLTQTSDVVIETLGASGDTEIWLYDASLTEIDYDDDDGTGTFSLISRPAVPPGTYYLKVEAFSGTSVIADYAISLGATAVSQPDLTVPTYSSAGPTVREGQSFWVEAHVRNAGSAAAAASHIRLFLSTDDDFNTSDDYEILPKKSVSSLAPDGTVSVRWDFTFPNLLGSSTYPVWVVFEVDSDGEVPESDEVNTFKAITDGFITVSQAADLAATNVYFRTAPNGGTIVSNPTPGQQLYPHIEYTVSAESTVSGPAWKLELNATLLCQFDDGISAGTYVGWCSTPWTATAGLHSLHGAVDPNGVTAETNEANNDTYRNYTVSGSAEIRVTPLDLHFEESAGSLPARMGATEIGSTPLVLRFRDQTVTLSERDDAARDLATAVAGAAPGERRHLLLQFQHLLSPGQRRELEKSGVRVLRYMPDNAYWAAVTAGEALSSVERAAPLHAVWNPTPDLKMSSEARLGEFPINARFEDGTVLIHAMAFEDVQRDQFAAAIATVNGAILQREVSGGTFAVRVPQQAIAQVAALDVVEWVEPGPPARITHNVTSAQRIQVDELQAAPYSLDGSGLDIGIWDGGSVGSHSDFGARVSLHDAGSAVSDHATHVAGTTGGSGGGNSNARGMAPAADIHSWEWTDDSAEMRSEAGAANVVISNHSYGWITGWHYTGTAWEDYGSGRFGEYAADASEWDDIVADTGLLIFKSAGNDRTDGPDWPTGPRMDGPYDTITTPGTSKNLITVCATADDDSMSSFSGWGPANDGRVKPDLCANGVGLTSTLPGGNYGSYSGTSMASPSAAGAGLLLFEWFRQENGSDPEPHLLKALLIHGAEDLGRTGPDYEHGWGLINAEASAEMITAGNWALASVAATGAEATWQLDVSAGTPELKVTAVWTDPAASPGAAFALVNDLDFVLVAPNGTTFRPWVLNPAAPSANATRGVNDVDNVEQVLVTSPMAGSWTVRVVGTAVAIGPQAVAVVAPGLGGTSPGPNTQSFTIHNDGTTDLNITNMALDQSGAWIGWTPAAPFTIGPGEERQVDVSVDFNLAPATPAVRRLLIYSSDADESPYPNGVNIHVGRGGGVAVSTSAVTVSEAGSTATFTVVLTAQPTGNVVIDVSSTDTGEATVSPARLTFTSVNWAGAQTVTVTGVNDALDDGNQTSLAVLTMNASLTADARFDAIDPADVTVTTTDDDKGTSTTTIASSINPSVAGQSVTFTATVSGTGTPTGTVTFKDGSNVLGVIALTGSTAVFTTANLALGNHAMTAQYSGDANFNGSTSAVLNQVVNLAAPASFAATGVSASAVSLSWTAVIGAASYEVHRATAVGGAFTVFSTASTTYQDTAGLTANRTYLYKVRARAGAFLSPFTAIDVGTTIAFTDPVLSTALAVKPLHVTQLRTAVNSVRAAAGLPAAVFTDATLVARASWIKRVHVTELRTALDEARSAIGLTPIAYVDPVLTAKVTTVKGSHILQLRAGSQ